jgi:hypothetical protein
MSKLWDWFKAFLRNPIASLRDLADKLYAGVKAIIDRLEWVFSKVFYAWTHPIWAVKSFVGLVADLGRDAYNGLRWLWEKGVKPLLVKIGSLELKLVDYFWEGIKRAGQLVAEAVGAVWDYLGRFKTWILEHVWQPLETGVKQAWNWIVNQGAIIWDLIQHPEKLAALLLAPLAKAAWWFVRQSADLIAQLLLGGWIKATLALADVVEDVFAKLV